MIDRLVYLAYRLGAGLFGLLPEPAARRLGGGAGRLAWAWAGERKAMALRHARRAQGRPADGAGESAAETARARAGARAMFASYGRYWAETFWFRPRRVEAIRRHMEVEGMEYVREAAAKGIPVLAALPHLGNWEMAGALAEQAGVEITAVAEALDNRLVTDWFIGLRAALSIDVVLAEGRRTLPKLTGALRPGRVLALVADRDMTGRGAEVDFFGERTVMPAGPAALALRTGSMLLPVAIFFRRGRGHRAVIGPPVPTPAGADIESVTGELARRFERFIRAAPEQWHLVQPNWPSDRAFLEQRRAGS